MKVKGYAAEGKEQMRFGEEAKALISMQTSETMQTEFARIAAWHYEKSVRCLRQAADEFENAAQNETDREWQKNLREKSMEMIKLASAAEYAGREPRQFLDKKLNFKGLMSNAFAVS